MGRRTLVVVSRDDGLFDCRLAHWGVDADPLAQSRPLGSGWTRSRIRVELDATLDAVMVVDGHVMTYLVCWLDPLLSDLADVALARTDDPDALRDWWTETKSQACEAVAAGRDPTAVRGDLLAALRLRVDAVHVDDASFLRDDR